MSRKLEGRIAIVTGGSTGIGLATAKRFASEGAHVIVTGRRQAELDAAVSAIGNATSVRVDSSNMAELDRLFDRVRLEIGRIDVLFVNAGGGSLLPLGKITEEHYDTAASGGTEAFSVYAASKAAVRSFARNWILDLEGRGIRVNTLSPGPTKTPGFFGLAGPDAARQQRMLDALASRIPMGRVGDPDEIAKAAVFLASDDSSFVNGIELFVEGGKAQI
ncbi:Glucose 1-dehydrogenase 1 [compost metagenome]